jgi:hypothetical protein
LPTLPISKYLNRMFSSGDRKPAPHHSKTTF